MYALPHTKLLIQNKPKVYAHVCPDAAYILFELNTIRVSVRLIWRKVFAIVRPCSRAPTSMVSKNVSMNPEQNCRLTYPSLSTSISIKSYCPLFGFAVTYVLSHLAKADIITHSRGFIYQGKTKEGLAS